MPPRPNKTVKKKLIQQIINLERELGLSQTPRENLTTKLNMGILQEILKNLQIKKESNNRFKKMVAQSQNNTRNTISYTNFHAAVNKKIRESAQGLNNIGIQTIRHKIINQYKNKNPNKLFGAGRVHTSIVNEIVNSITQNKINSMRRSNSPVSNYNSENENINEIEPGINVQPSENEKRNSAATKIAATVKARQAAKRFQEKRKAATKIAAAVKGRQARQSLQRLKESQVKIKEQKFRSATNAVYFGMKDFPQKLEKFRTYLKNYKQFSGNSKYQEIKQAIENYNKIEPDLNKFSAFLTGVNKTNAKRRLRAYKIRCAKLGTTLVGGSKICQNRNALMLKVNLETLNLNAPNAPAKLRAMISRINKMSNAYPYKKLLKNTASRIESKIAKK